MHMPPAMIESMLKGSGGVQVIYDGKQTWGHLNYDRASNASLIVATGILAEVESGRSITVDGREYRVGASRPRGDGAETLIELKQS